MRIIHFAKICFMSGNVVSRVKLFWFEFFRENITFFVLYNEKGTKVAL